MTPNERYEKLRRALKSGDIQTVKEYAKEAEKRLMEKGYVLAPPYFGWIKGDLLEEAINNGAIVATEDGFYPVAVEIEEEKVDKYVGRTAIMKKEIKLDTSKFMDFLKKLEEG